MTASGNLWAIGYDDLGRATQARDVISRLGWGTHYMNLDDLAILVRHPDGSLTVDREPFPAVTNIVGWTTVGFLAGLVVAAPLAGAAVGALLSAAGSAVGTHSVGIGDDFVREVERVMTPGTSALFVLDHEGDMEVILHAIRGLGGTVLRTNVDVERVKLIQSALAAAPADTGDRP